MLGVLVCYASFHEFMELQSDNFRNHIKCPYMVFSKLASVHPDPSTGHQENLNELLQAAWDRCDSFLIIDNDMIFLNDFTEPSEDCWYLPQKRNDYEYAWANLLYFKKHELMRRIWFENGSDSGGSTWRYLLQTPNKRRIQMDDQGFDAYRKDIERINKQYGLGNWHERYILNGTEIFHFRAMSNWTNYPKDYIKAKEKMILEHVRYKNEMDSAN